VQSYVITDAIGRNQHAYALCLASFRVTPCFGRALSGPVFCVFVFWAGTSVQRTCVYLVFTVLYKIRVLGDLFGRPLPKHRDHRGRRQQLALHAA